MTLPSKGFFCFCFGLTEEISCLILHNTSHWTLAQRIDHALLLWGASFTVGTADEGPHNATVPRVLSLDGHHTKALSCHAQPMFLSVVTPMTIKPEPCHHFRPKTHHSLHTRVSSPHSNLPWRFFVRGLPYP